jgi:hypothetical protein
MKAHQLAQKRHTKKLRRKNKKYTGPKYSKLEQMVLWAPMLERAGIQMFAEQMPEGVMRNVENKDTNTSFV